jgi:Zn-dependent protease with chaperone function
MAIQIVCGACQKTLRVKDEFAGRIAKCPQCQSKVQIPAMEAVPRVALDPPQLSKSGIPETPAPLAASQPSTSNLTSTATASKAPSQLMREILAGFQGQFPRVKPTILYRVAAMFVATVMVLLPIVYVALICLVGWGVFWHATNNASIMSSVRGGRAMQVALLAYIGPMIVGGISILFMIKPLFARSVKREQEIPVSFTEETLLHSFIQRLCTAVGAPIPKVIEVNCDVNAAAFYRRGLFRSEVGLIIGLPLLSALTMRQFAGVMAHELGHCSQGAGMNLSNLIRSINFWFIRVIYERDDWDEFLDSCMEEQHIAVIAIAGLTKLLVYLTRRILYVLMLIGHGVSCFLLRQMEYDADKYEIRLSGSDVFESTTRRLRELGIADAILWHTIGANAERFGLPDNLPMCLARFIKILPPEHAKMVDNIVTNQKTSLFATHPEDRDRIAAAKKEGAKGIFLLEGPAKSLVKDFDSLAEKSTKLRFHRLIGKSTAKQLMIPTPEFVAQLKSAIAAKTAAEEWSV